MEAVRLKRAMHMFLSYQSQGYETVWDCWAEIAWPLLEDYIATADVY